MSRYAVFLSTVLLRPVRVVNLPIVQCFWFVFNPITERFEDFDGGRVYSRAFPGVKEMSVLPVRATAITQHFPNLIH
ncbi:MAG: hypothetical protein RBQ88_08595 [Desulfobulbus oligotrophicus]|nr:hypothetical protein [Desulfobulbus oligotrophicus]